MEDIKVKKLDIGCGISKREGYTGVDILDLPGVDIKHDLNKFPYPFKDNEIDEVWMDQLLEHLNEPMKAMEEIYRICKSGAMVYVGVPYFRSFYAVIDPTHKNFIGVYWFDYFDPDTDINKKYRYTEAKFKVEKIEFDREYRNTRVKLLHRLMIKIANRKPKPYEERLSHLYPLNSLTFYLKVIK